MNAMFVALTLFAASELAAQPGDSLTPAERQRFDALTKGWEPAMRADLLENLGKVDLQTRAKILDGIEKTLPKSSPLTAQEKQRFDSATKEWKDAERQQMLKDLLALDSKARHNILKSLEDAVTDVQQGQKDQGFKKGGSQLAVVQFVVHAPPGSKLWFNDHLTTSAANSIRYFTTPPLESGKTYAYKISVESMMNGQPMLQTRTVRFQAGEQVKVVFGSTR
jgi:uncharacterized protein (TIGR03000 family)